MKSVTERPHGTCAHPDSQLVSDALPHPARAALERIGVTHAAIAKLTGLPELVVRETLDGRRRVGFEIREAVAHLTTTPPNLLFRRDAWDQQ